MEQQTELAHRTGEIDGEAEHMRGCLCTGCATERELERDGRYDSSIASHLHHIKDLRALREVPGSTGAGEYTPKETAGCIEQEPRYAVSPSPMADKDAA